MFLCSCVPGSVDCSPPTPIFTPISITHIDSLSQRLFLLLVCLPVVDQTWSVGSLTPKNEQRNKKEYREGNSF